MSRNIPQEEYYDDAEIKSLLHEIMRSMGQENWRPDYIVGITRGGLIPAVMMSHYLDVPVHTLDVSTRDAVNNESNLWMAEDAFGYIYHDPMTSGDGKKNILILDDINDTGRTFQWIKDDWTKSCLPNDERWNQVWGHNVRFAVLINNEASDFKDISYSGDTINKMETPSWIVFPWEAWWAQ